jgi:hypothetical protein
MTYRDATWPELPLSAWKDTYATLHLWTQIVGKIRLAQTPWLNHSWHVVLYVSARGLTTSAIPYGDRSFQLDFDFLDHVLRASASDGGQEEIGLYPRSVADFYAEVMRSLAELGINIRINELPNEIPDAIRFSRDRVHASYHREYAVRFWRILVQSARVLGRFRTSFIGKCSPVHFFWGSFDLAVTRFSGRKAPPFHAERCRAQHAGGGRARCLLARMFERRLLARWPGCRLPGFLYLRLAITSGLRFGGDTPGAGFLEQQPEPVQSALRCGAHRRRP